ncbi:hypothetical protein O181_062234 [Austropuccinia psidii MF-1]|uniref:Reverse transcriptase RNase H-like domain-containing protein n=1 Tax=Austropuccinia psidii MF-1 TaxID=1389203 RepID=A0A9Q3I1D1_9BASI|nr:hypothetical protein [Austropuccinia psidii MF-1]
MMAGYGLRPEMAKKKCYGQIAIEHQKGPIGHKKYGVTIWSQLGSRLELLQHPWRWVNLCDCDNERIKYELKNAPVLILPDFQLPFKLYIDAACSQGLGAALHQGQIVDGEPREGVICYISRHMKDTEGRYGATQTECKYLVWALQRLYYHSEVTVFEVYTDCTALKSLLKMKTTIRHMLR